MNKSIFYMKALLIMIISFLTIFEIFSSFDNHMIYQSELNSLILFLNDHNPSNNIITFFVEILLKVLFQIDLSDISSFFENINPLY